MFWCHWGTLASCAPSDCNIIKLATKQKSSDKSISFSQVFCCSTHPTLTHSFIFYLLWVFFYFHTRLVIMFKHILIQSWVVQFLSWYTSIHLFYHIQAISHSNSISHFSSLKDEHKIIFLSNSLKVRKERSNKHFKISKYSQLTMNDNIIGKN